MIQNLENQNYTNSIKLMIVDDHPIILEGLKGGLIKFPQINLVMQASSGKEVLESVLKSQPDVILLDVGLPDISGIEVAHILKKETPQIKIIIYTMYDSPEYLKNFIKIGVKGYVLKDSSVDEVAKAIFTVAQGGTYFDSESLQNIIKNKSNNIQEFNQSSDSLTVREKEVLILITKGLKNKEIAEQLQINARTIETHRRNLMIKLKIKTPAGLTKYALENNLIDSN